MPAIPRNLPELFERAMNCHRAGDLLEARRLYRSILRAVPNQFETLLNCGLLEAQRGRHEEALRLLKQALRVDPGSAEANSNLGGVYLETGRADQALACFDKALTIDPSYLDALFNRGNVLRNLKRNEEALAAYEAALAISPGHFPALINKSNVLKDLGRCDEALDSLNKARAIKPDEPGIFVNLGAVQRKSGRPEDALASYRQALAINPNYFDALNNLGNVLVDLDRNEEALDSYNRALAVKPDDTEALGGRGDLLMKLQRNEEAIVDIRRLLKLDPDFPYAIGDLVHSRMRICDWGDWGREWSRLRAGVQAGKRCATPFVLLPTHASSAEQLLCARIWTADKNPPAANPVWRGERYQHERIRIAYLSADFHDHPMAFLTAGLFEQHDRSRFETIALSFGPDSRSEMRSRLKAAFERFIDVRQVNDREIAKLMRELEVDIAVDLMGFTAGCRTGIFAFRPAPIQVNYLGYAGTLGADYIDYILADRMVVPEAQQVHYAEKLVYLPGTFQVNDSKRRIGDCSPTRAQAGLPGQGVIFCSFNNNFKITPDVFDVWMRLLCEVEGSVLWLQQSNEAAAGNLKHEAARRGVAPDRLIFAPRTTLLEDHLARYRLADMFLDTLPYNAHTTASDALWAGLPVLTCLGTTFAGRVAASLLNAVGLPELITNSLQDYEGLALKLATDRERLAELRAKLQTNIPACPLFDTNRFRKHLEAAYQTMWERWQRGDNPASFAVSA